VTLLHGSPSKKDFLDKIKQLKKKDEEEEKELSTDHDLKMYTSTPVVIKEKPKNIEVTSYKSCEMKVKFNMNKLKEKYRLMNEKEDISSSISDHHFNIHIEENQNEEAEDELKRQIDKSDFERMSIIGQFNRGFILATLVDHSSQLFIVDQHAADEIFNFHRLYQQTSISRQPLLHPKTIPLDPSRQVLLQQHLDLFTRLG
jgi:DNA mismatch repair ATPase MutL